MHRKRNQRKLDVHFEEQVLQTEVGSVETKQNAELFFEDKAPSATSTKKRWQNRLLRSEQLFQHSDALEAKKKAQITERTSFRRMLKEYDPQKHRNVRRQSEIEAVKNAEKEAKKRKPGKYDLWDSTSRPADERQPVVDTTGGWLDQIQPPKERVAEKPKSKVRAIPLPSSSESFRPEQTAYEDDVVAETVRVQKQKKDLDALRRSVQKINRKVLMRKQEEAHKQQALAILGDSISDSSVMIPDMAVDVEAKPDSNQKNKKKEKQQQQQEEIHLSSTGKRNSQKRLKRNREMKRPSKKRINSQLEHLSSIVAEVENQVATNEQRQELKKEQRKQQKEKTIKKLGPYAFVPDPKTMMTPDEVPNTLREMPNVAPLLRERFQSFQQRNLIETRRKVRKNPSKRRKMVERRPYKIPENVEPATFIASL